MTHPALSALRSTTEEATVKDLLARGVRFFRQHGFLKTLRRALRELPTAERSKAPAPPEPSNTHLPVSDDETYQRWINAHEPAEEDLRLQREIAARLGHRPLISIVTPVFNPDIRVFRDMLDSVLCQTYDNWELCLADASTEPLIRTTIEEYRGRDSRIVVRYLSANRGIALNSNEALTLAQGEFVALLDHDDMLAPFALFEVVQAINHEPDLEFIFSDRDVMTYDGKRAHPFFKPGWSPDYLLAQNYLCHLSVISKKVMDELGGFRSGYDGSQDYDLYLRVTELTDRIIHLPHILYHWRIVPGSSSVDPTAKTYAYDAAVQVLRDAAVRRGWNVSIDRGSSPGCYDLDFKISGLPLVSVVIASLAGRPLLSRCIASLEQSTYGSIEVVVVLSSDVADRAMTVDLSSVRTRVPLKIFAPSLHSSRAALFNFGAEHSDAEYLVFLDEETEVITPAWLEKLVGLVQRNGTGAAGPRMITPAGNIHSAGLIVDRTGSILRSHHGFPRDHHGYNSMIKNLRNVSAIDCCLAVRRHVFEEVGGFDQRFDAYCMIDLCMKLRRRHMLITYQPQAEFLFHGDDTSLHDKTPTDERTLFMERWSGDLAGGDPYYSPNLSAFHEDFSLNI